MLAQCTFRKKYICFHSNCDKEPGEILEKITLIRGKEGLMEGPCRRLLFKIIWGGNPELRGWPLRWGRTRWGDVENSIPGREKRQCKYYTDVRAQRPWGKGTTRLQEWEPSKAGLGRVFYTSSPQPFGHQGLVSWKTIIPWTGRRGTVLGWLKHITFIVHIICAFIISASPKTIRHYIPEVGEWGGRLFEDWISWMA